MQNKWRDIGDVGTVGIAFVLWLAVGYYGGRWLDGRFFGGHGWVTAAGSVFGVVGAFREIYEASRRMQRRLDEEDKESRADKERGRRDGRRDHDDPDGRD